MKAVESPALKFEAVTRAYPGRRHPALSEVSFELSGGDQVAIVGRSGSGKSTLMHLAAGIDLPTSGSVRLFGKELHALSDWDRTLLRREKVGLVFQFFYLLPHLSVGDNIAMPEFIAGTAARQFEPRVRHLLEKVGLLDRIGDNVDKLSGGEMQRVAICRALLRRPGLILADEPTGNLDDQNAAAAMDLMLSLARQEGSALVFVTHSRELAAMAQQVWTLRSGILERGGS